MDATDVEVTDYIPTGLNLADGAWAQSGSLATRTIAGPIAANGGTATVTISFTIDANFQGTSIVNYAEISDATNALGLADDDSTPDQDNTNDAGGQPNSPADDAVDGDGSGTPGDGVAGTDEDDHDPAQIDVEQNFDLALRKSVISSGPYMQGSTVTYQIEVINQGSLDATDVEITDYIPTGLNLADGAWAQAGSLATRTIAGPIAANGGIATVTISFTIDANFQGANIVNYAEISDADNALNVPDVDSTPDQDNTNDAGGQPDSPADDAVNGDGTGTPGDGVAGTDEDDHDPATIEVDQDFDLALRKVLSSATPGPFAQGSTVTYEIEITNQGTIDATNVEVTDYIPMGLNLADGAWSQSGSLATRTIAGPIAANGGTATVTITFQIDGNFQGASIINYAEISDADNALNLADEDSTPDQDNTNDAGGEPNSPADDHIDGNGTGTPGDGVAATDEDDHDPVEITVDQSFDLALTKVLSPDTPGPFVSGSTVTFVIEVTNQGSIDATNVEITDYIPAELTLADFTWSPTGSQATKLIPGPIAANGGTAQLSITFLVNATPDAPIVNYAEISGAENVLNLPDVDSTPDQDNTNDAGGQPNSPADNAINGNGTGTPGDGVASTDEDDHDPATISVLQLDKTFISAIQLADGTFDVTYTVTVTNFGIAGQYDLTDTPMFDDDITINSGSYTSDAPGNANGPLPGSGPWTLADDQSIAAGTQHTYTLTLNVTLDLDDGVGNDQYESCHYTLSPNKALFNKADLDINNDGQSDLSDDDCGELPATELDKVFDYALPQVDGSYNVKYTITVSSVGGAPEQYDLTDTPMFDDDVIINSASYTSTAPGNAGGALAGIGPWTLAVGQDIGVGESHTYELIVNVTIDIDDNIGDNNYENCDEGLGLLNEAAIDVTDDGQPDDTAEDCGDVECDITAEFEVVCDDNDTPDNPNDDLFFVYVTVNGISTSGGWHTTGDPNGSSSGNYGEETILGPYSILNNNSFIMFIQDDQDSGCLEILEIDAPDTCSPECVITSIDAETDCFDNGTPDDPDDDLFSVVISVNAQNPPSNLWVALLDGNPVASGPYNGIMPIQTLFPISDGGFTLVIQDSQNPDLCNDIVEVIPPAPCSEDCNVGVEFVLDPVCDDNDTPFDPTDDTFTFSLLVTGNNTGNNGWITNTGLSGSYNDIVSFGPYLISDGSFSIVFADADDITCIESVLIVPPPPCDTEECFIQANATPFCDNNGTPGTSDDDVFFVDLVVTGFNTGTGWTTSDNSGSGNYGQTVTVGPYLISDGPVTITIVDNEDPTCTTEVTVTPPNTCSTQCVISADVTGSEMCNDNGTPADPSDDFFTFTVVVSADNNTGTGGWVASNGATGNYGEPTTMGPFPADGSIIEVTFTDAQNPNCFTTVEVSSDPCSGQCAITATVQFVACDNNGTPTDPDDDQFVVGVFVSSPSPQNTSGFWTTDDPILGGGNFQYGELIVFGPYPISSGFVSINVFDVGNPSCAASVTAQAPPPCPECEIFVEDIDNIVCDDNGTPFDSSDDTFTFEATIDALNGSALGWSQVLPGGGTGIQGPYGVPTTFGPYNIADGPVNIRVRDRGDAACYVDFTVDPPAPCSDGCEIDVVIEDVRCSNNGTPTDPSDDTFVVELTVIDVDGAGQNGWTAQAGGNTFTGNYGSTVVIGPFDISDGMITIDIQDVDDPMCGVSVDVDVPNTCSTICELDIEVDDIICDDQDTDDLLDDTYTFELTVNAENSDAGWTATINGTTYSGQYGESVTVGPFLISGGNATVIVEDNDGDCSESFDVEAPLPCSEVDPECAILVTLDNVVNIECDDQGTSDQNDDTFSFDVLVTGTNTSNSWTATVNGQTFTGNYGASVTIGDFPISDGDITITFVDNDDPDCTATLTVPAPDPCSPPEPCVIEASILDIDCDDMNTPETDDDTFVVTIEVTGDNTANSWIGEDNTTGAYGVPVVIGPFPADGSIFEYTITDANDPDCQTTITIMSPMDCGTDCDVSAEVSNVICDDNDTPNDPSDDTYTFDLLVNGENLGSGWTASDGTTGEYGVVQTFGPYNILSDGDVNLTIIGNANDNCIVLVYVSAPEPCSVPVCEIDVEIDNILCDNNGTPFDPSDDTFTFDATVTTTGTSSIWLAVDGQGNPTTGLFGMTHTFGPYPIDGGDVELTFTDALDPNCDGVTVVVEAPNPCSDACDITVDLADEYDVSVVCDDNNTPFDPSDDTFTFEVIVSGMGTSDDGWTANDGTMGDYDVVVVFGPYPISGGDVTIDFTDKDNDECTATITVPAPEPCSDGVCEITATVGEVICDDNNTPDDPSDDTFTFELTVTGNGGQSTGWNANDGSSGPYDQTVVVGPYPVEDGAVTLVISDDFAFECTTSVTVEPPSMEVECPDDVSEVTVDGVTSDLICTDLDEILNNQESLVYTGAPIMTNSCGFDYLEFEDELTGGGLCEDAIITRTFTIFATDGSSVECVQEITVRPAYLADVISPMPVVEFSCSDMFEVDENGFPDPSVSGYPYVLTAFGEHELNDSYCNLSASYEDEVLVDCGKGKEIMRTWTIVDACDPDAQTIFTQMINVGDIEGPIVECPLSNHYCPIIEDDIMLFSVDPFECTATIEVPIPDVTDDCSTEWTIETEIVTDEGVVILNYRTRR